MTTPITKPISRTEYDQKILDLGVVKGKQQGLKDYLTKINGIVIGSAVVMLVLRLFLCGFSFVCFIFSFLTWAIIAVTVLICGPVLAVGMKEAKAFDKEIAEKEADLALHTPNDCK